MNASGSNQRPIVQDFVYLWAGDWSPDGGTLVFAMETDCPAGWKEACNREIYTMPATGGPKTRLTFEEANDWNPVWASP